MHFADDYTIMERIKIEADKNPSFKKVKIISKRGEVFNLIID